MKKNSLAGKGAKVVMALAIALAMAPAAPAYAADSAAGTDGEVVKTFTYTSEQAKPKYDESIEVDGKTLVAASEDVKLVSTAPMKVPCGKTETKECAPGDLEATKASFPEEAEFDEDGIKGMIPLVSVEEVPVMATVSYQCDRTATYTGLPTNDAAQIPAEAGFTADSGNYVILARAGLTFSVEAYDEYGLPSSYSAVVGYRGVDSYEVIDHYEVTATYEGEVANGKTTDTYEMTVTYKEPGTFGLAGIIGGIAGAAVAALAVWKFVIPAFFRRKRIEFYEYCDRDGTKKRIARAKLSTTSTVLSATVPSDVELTFAEPGRYVIAELPEKLAGSDRSLVLTWRGQDVYSGPAAKSLIVKASNVA